MSKRQAGHLETIYKGRFDSIAPFLQKGVFDRRVLGELHGIRAACRPHDLIGQFVSEDGNPTRVTLQLLPDEGGQQAWRVVAISRELLSGEESRLPGKGPRDARRALRPLRYAPART